MKKIAVVLVLAGLLGCSSPEEAQYTLHDVQVSGEFLIEGPNTLQGKPGPVLDRITEELSLSVEDLKAVHLQSAEIEFMTDTLRSSVQSALVQWVSDDLELVSVATRSPLPETDPVILETSAEQDLLPYLKDESATVVVDVNLAQDMEFLEARVTMVFNVKYRK